MHFTFPAIRFDLGGQVHVLRKYGWIRPDCASFSSHNGAHEWNSSDRVVVYQLSSQPAIVQRCLIWILYNQLKSGVKMQSMRRSFGQTDRFACWLLNVFILIITVESLLTFGTPPPGIKAFSLPTCGNKGVAPTRCFLAKMALWRQHPDHSNRLRTSCIGDNTRSSPQKTLSKKVTLSLLLWGPSKANPINIVWKGFPSSFCQEWYWNVPLKPCKHAADGDLFFQDVSSVSCTWPSNNECDPMKLNILYLSPGTGVPWEPISDWLTSLAKLIVL